jgi:hypothetical protein
MFQAVLWGMPLCSSGRTCLGHTQGCSQSIFQKPSNFFEKYFLQACYEIAQDWLL